MRRRVSDLFEALSEESRAKLRRRPQPGWLEPMLATLTQERFSHPDWIYERKLDGVRCLVFRKGSAVRLASRNRRTMSASWPELVEDLEAEPCDDFVADGEIVAFEGNRTSFSRLQNRIGLRNAEAARRTGIAVHLYLFDLLHVDGHDTTELPLRDRKALLKRALSFQGRIRYTDPQGSRKGFGALLVGYYEHGELRYAGKVGTGFDAATLENLSARLRRIERRRSPFADRFREKGAHFVRPELVGEFAFTEWTEDGKLRHPRFLGLRTDKEPADVEREGVET